MQINVQIFSTKPFDESVSAVMFAFFFFVFSLSLLLTHTLLFVWSDPLFHPMIKKQPSKSVFVQQKKHLHFISLMPVAIIMITLMSLHAHQHRYSVGHHHMKMINDTHQPHLRSIFHRLVRNMYR